MFVRIATSAALAVAMSTTAVARDYVSIAGSSTVLPFATIVAERLGRTYNQKPRSLNLAVRRLVRKVFVTESEQSSSISVTHRRG